MVKLAVKMALKTLRAAAQNVIVFSKTIRDVVPVVLLGVCGGPSLAQPAGTDVLAVPCLQLASAPVVCGAAEGFVDRLKREALPGAATTATDTTITTKTVP